MGAIQQKTGNGTIPFIELAMEICSSSTELQRYPFIKPLPTFRMLRKKTKAETSERKRITRQAKAKN